MSCKAEGFTACTKRFTTDYCKKHYSQVRKYGKPIITRCDPRPAIIEGDLAKIPLGIEAKDGFAIVDKRNAKLDQYKWYKDDDGYAVTSVKNNVGIYKRHKMHNMVFGQKKIKAGYTVDHISRDRADNRKSNLRLANASQNQQNKGIQKNNSTGYKGVYFCKHSQRFIVAIGFKGKQTKYGKYKLVEDAAKRYNEVALKLHGEFAYQNKVGA